MKRIPKHLYMQINAIPITTAVLLLAIDHRSTHYSGRIYMAGQWRQSPWLSYCNVKMIRTHVYQKARPNIV